MSAPVAVINDTVSPVLQRRAQRVGNSEQLNKVVGETGLKVFRQHFVGMGKKEKNKFGAPSRFWLRMVRLTTMRANGAGATIIMPYELRLRLKGGTVRPTGGRKALAIPESRRTYGKSPRMFKDLIFIPPEEGESGKFRGMFRFPGKAYTSKIGGVTRGSLSGRDRSTKVSAKSVSQGQGLGERAFSLWAFTKHKPNPSVLPNRDTIATGIRRVVNAWITKKEGNA